MNRKMFLLTDVAVLSFLVISAVAQEVAQDFTLTDIDENEFALSNYRGKVVLLDFFATLCSLCVDEIPHLKSLHEEFGEDLIIISISVNPHYDTVRKLRSFRQEHEIDWIIARDTIGVGDKYNVQFIPDLVIIDQKGYIQYRHGYREKSVLRDEILEIIPEFGTWVSVIFVFLAVTVVVIISKRRILKTQKVQSAEETK